MEQISAASLQELQVSQLRPHPDNPRLYVREEKVENFITWMKEAGGLQQEYALLVRPMYENGTIEPSYYQVIAGHHRRIAAERAELVTIPCWVREMSDEEALYLLLTTNEHSENELLEIGIHALICVPPSQGKKGEGLQAYAERVGKKRPHVSSYRSAAIVFNHITSYNIVRSSLFNKAHHLSAIHHAHEDTWPVLAESLVNADWSVEETEKAVKRVKALWDIIPDWWVSLNRLELTANVIEKANPSMLAMLKQADELASSLKTQTVYRLEPTDETRIHEGRELRKYVSVPEIYETAALFRVRVNALDALPDRAAVDAIAKALLQYGQDHSQVIERWQAVLTDEEWMEQQARTMEIEALERKQYYQPVLLRADVMEGLRTIRDESIDLICTDPPFNMDKAEWDTIENYGAWVKLWIQQCYRVLKPSGSIYIFQRQNSSLAQTIIALEAVGFHSLADPPLDRDCVQGTGAGPYGGNREMILFYSKTDEPYINTEVLEVERAEEDKRAYRGQTYETKKIGGILRFPALDEKDPERVDFPTQKPVALLELLIKASCPHTGRVLDCFIGSGSTGVAAIRLERRCICIDRETKHLDLARGRFEQTEVGQSL